LPVTELLARLLELGLSGLEFAAGLPGSVGGAVYMNARCYDREMADVLDAVFYLDPAGPQTRHICIDRTGPTNRHLSCLAGLWPEL
jgi:UDP-N-acetylmuramate dehydrogenase